MSPPLAENTESQLPFHGDFSGCAWNAQALFAAKACRQLPKMRKVIKLASSNDFTIVEEAHCISGRGDALRLPSHLTALWSNGTASVAGIGIILNRDFLCKFNTIIPNRDWVEVIPGRVAILKLRGRLGALDIICAYLPTGDSTFAAQRRSDIISMGSHIQPNTEVLTVLAGDFNFVENERDRYCTSSGNWTGLKDIGEAQAFHDHIRLPHQMHEWEQGHFTCEAGGARSRIDRMYTNQHVSFQLDRHIACNVLEWDKSVSVHRPIVFSRRSAKPKSPGQKAIPANEFSREGWKESVIQNFRFLCKDDDQITNPARKLLLLKDAIRNTYNMRHEDSLSLSEEASSSPDDKLGYAMSCLKAIESGRADRASRCARAYPRLWEWIPDQPDDLHVSAKVAAIRNHVLELAREQIRIDIHSVSVDSSIEPEDKVRVKESILRKLKRLTPGEASGLGAMVNKHGGFETKPEEIAQILREHWQGVFSEKVVRETSVQIWMEELFIKDENGCYITGLPDKSEGIWKITRKSVRKAIQIAKDSMPGPDGIPSAAYKKLGETAVDILLEVAIGLCSMSGREMLRDACRDRCQDGWHDFNLSLLCCLPKKPYGVDPEQGEYYRGEDTRPLALVNTDNRIIANAGRIVWEPILNQYISKAQQGFLKGRHMLNNVIDIDYDSMRVSLKCSRGVLVLFDFKAAFPSVAHGFLKASLAALGLPQHALNFIGSLYDNNYCNISFNGNVFEGFEMLCGVRQGCPISPLLFAASVDVLLRILHKRISSGTFRAFADDIGAIFENWDRDSIIAEQVFREFAEMSGLELNVEKTVCIPLWERGREDIEQTLRASGRSWSNMCIAEEGTYLGFCVGPGRYGKSWKRPVQKFSKRCEQWGGMGLGLMFSTVAYNAFASSTLAFVAQLEEPDEHVYRAEIAGITKMTPGPGNWRQCQDAFYLKESWGQQCSFKSVCSTAAAAKLRVKYTHDCDRRRGESCSPISVQNMAKDIIRSTRNSEHAHRAALWNKWYESSYPVSLERNEQTLSSMHGIRVDSILHEIAGGAPPWSVEVRSKQKKLLQRCVAEHLKRLAKPDPHNRLREKIDRWLECKGNEVGWGLPGPPAHIVRRMLRHLQKLPVLVPPRVCAAVLRTFFNGWCTERRFQRRYCSSNICMLGCRAGAEDSIEHYCRCPALRTVLKSRLRVSVPNFKGLSFWLMNDSCVEEEELLICSALINYAGYMATNMFRNSTRAANNEVAANAISQFITQSAIGHPATARFLDSRWAAPIRYIL